METTLAEVVTRLERLEDLEAIRATWLDYCTRLDSGDWAGLGDVFTEDASLEMDGLKAFAPGLDGGYRGRTSIIDDFYRRTGTGGAEGRQVFATGHLSTNMQIDLQGDEATTLAYFFEIVGNDRVLVGLPGAAGGERGRGPVAAGHPFAGGATASGGINAEVTPRSRCCRGRYQGALAAMVRWTSRLAPSQ
jgi:hypothetical protein